VRERSGGSALVENFVRNKAVARQYHSWFQWDENNANQFYGLFGAQFRSEMSNRVKGSDDLRTGVAAFLELGSERNRLVHQDYTTFPLDKTLDEIYALYRTALTFVEHLPGALRDCDGSPEGKVEGAQVRLDTTDTAHSNAQPGPEQDAPQAPHP
jgi:hypothetical protein